MTTAIKASMALVILVVLNGCTTSTTIDEYRELDGLIAIDRSEKVVILGRRHAGEYETEPDFIDCIGDKLSANRNIAVLDEPLFLNSLYPWFEPRTAPLGLKRLQRILQEPLISNKINELGVRYMIWVDGNTETTDSSGSISCAIGPGGGGCFGFATWDKTSSYEAIIWDLSDLNEEGRVRVDTKGSSYLVGIGAPLPFIARVQGQACEGIGNQLRGFFDKHPTSARPEENTEPGEPS